ncbi:hypothetical protein BD311DRAFT_759813 [Dichomitus squalens]|uniref:Uncharacterized protein n=1 Tax=Dichomitus squalens TaxID=114155 RepID=A0A4Q9MNM8_9APHY|nr:hypothetical protein BD311DRAFT_759813 [Dichomitus squalens]
MVLNERRPISWDVSALWLSVTTQALMTLWDGQLQRQYAHACVYRELSGRVCGTCWMARGRYWDAHLGSEGR